MQDEVFNYFPLPDGRDVNRYTTLAILGESLVLLDPCPTYVNTWVMEQYGVAESWAKRVMNLDFEEFLNFKRNEWRIIFC